MLLKKSNQQQSHYFGHRSGDLLLSQNCDLTHSHNSHTRNQRTHTKNHLLESVGVYVNHTLVQVCLDSRQRARALQRTQVLVVRREVCAAALADSYALNHRSPAMFLCVVNLTRGGWGGLSGQGRASVVE